MSTDENRRTALKFIEALDGSSIDLSLVTEDLQWWGPKMGYVSKAEFLNILEVFQTWFKSRLTIKVNGVTAEGDRVAVEAESHGELKNGKIYRNTYHFLFEFRDGKICLTKEYNDTAYAAAALEKWVTPGAGAQP
jgi:ketosteroid isomerase-like protein